MPSPGSDGRPSSAGFPAARGDIRCCGDLSQGDTPIGQSERGVLLNDLLRRGAYVERGYHSIERYPGATDADHAAASV
jgi:hypothetical protein